MGLPDLRSTVARTGLSAFAAPLLASGSFSLLATAFGPWLLPRFVIIGAPFALAPVNFLGSLLLRHLGTVSRLTTVFLVGTDSEVRSMVRDLDGSHQRPLRLVGSASLEAIEYAALAEQTQGANPSLLVLSPTAQLDEVVLAVASEAHRNGTRVRGRLDFSLEWLGKMPLEELGLRHLMFDVESVHSVLYNRYKRVLDVAISLALLPVFLFILPFVFFGNLFGNKGPLFFRQSRVGQFGKPFLIVKFRSMKPIVGNQSEWTVANDPRVTRFGNVLRNYHLDELPQVWNVLKGELSFIGPRPEQDHYVEELRHDVGHYDMRNMVKPGLTGWAQVNYAYGATKTDALRKLEYDLYYIQRQSLSLDLRILARTARKVVRGTGR